jgi:MYXO-CTERM domain-containing protein
MTAPLGSRLVRILRIVLAATLAVAAFAGSVSPASAGGWAVASLDSIPAAAPGATTEVSFTILQHGVTPTDLDEGVGIEILDEGGATAFFPAVSDGATGHYAATVTFPERPGRYDWRVQMGWFGTHELGTIDVRASEPASHQVWSTIGQLTLTAAVLLAGVGLALSRRRRPDHRSERPSAHQGPTSTSANSAVRRTSTPLPASTHTT